MSVQNNTPASENAKENTIAGLNTAAPATVEHAVDSIPVAEATANTEAAVVAERTRITDIFALPEAEDKFAMCLEAAKLKLSVDDAKALLAASPDAKPQAVVSPLDAAMGEVTNPDIGAEGEVDGGADESTKLVNSIVAAGQTHKLALASK